MKTNAHKAELFAESVERHFGIECNNFDDTKHKEINPYILTPLDSINNGIYDKENDELLVADSDPQELISIVKFDLRKGKAPGDDIITHELLRLAIRTPFYIHLHCVRSVLNLAGN